MDSVSPQFIGRKDAGRYLKKRFGLQTFFLSNVVRSRRGTVSNEADQFVRWAVITLVER
jgi:hypothetical protein